MNENYTPKQLRQFQEIAENRQAEHSAKLKAEKERQRLAQVESGKCNIVPFPRNVKTKPFRSELTIEQSSLFVANRYEEDFFVREWKVVSKDHPEKIDTHKLTVGRTDEGERHWGVLKQVHQDAFYRLLQLWGSKNYPLGEIEGKPYGSLRVSAYELVQAIRGDDSRHHYRRTRGLLQELVAIPVVLETHRDGYKNRKQFTLLNSVTWDEKKIDPKTNRPKPGGKSEVTIMFSSMVTQGFLDKNYKTLLAAPYNELGSKKKRQRGELARLLYPYLDAQLSNKTHFHKSLTELASRFGLTKHTRKSYRKRQFLSAVKSLNGKPIKSSEYALRVSLRDSADGKDYIFEARREPSKQLSLPIA